MLIMSFNSFIVSPGFCLLFTKFTYCESQCSVTDQLQPEVNGYHDSHISLKVVVIALTQKRIIHLVLSDLNQGDALKYIALTLDNISNAVVLLQCSV